MGLQQVKEIMAFGTMRNALAKFGKRNFVIGEVREPGVALSFIQCDTGRYTKC